MSTFIVDPAESTEATEVGGTDVTASDNDLIVASGTSTDPTSVTTPDSGTVAVKSGATGSDILINGQGDATINISETFNDDGSVTDASGTAFQVDENYKGSVNVDLERSIVGTDKVDLNIKTQEGSSIADNAPNDGAGLSIDYYVNTGQGNDNVAGSSGSDFVRLGEGNDTVDAGDGNDLIRVGTGDDTVTLGGGNDKVYLTVDQLKGVGGADQTKTITDFKSGEDKISFGDGVAPKVEGIGTNEITIVYSFGDTEFRTTLKSLDGNFTRDDLEGDDIEFI